ncbi:indolepyruvate ferredoxin oxidoreductase family protein [Benzoatithermus flavus]|uniref:Indolepyruvate ferredoxin oxidoreductase family protein n=1 Tax=Benzoatithermus flavus TaxID=3108223 RepID=A0ABU8XLB2_9PROT
MTQLREVTLDDKYTATSGRIFVTGIQALVRLPIVQRQRDLAAGLSTAGYITGYRGSPLGTYDQQLERAKAHLAAHHVVHKPGVNEDLAATACAGTQQVGLDGESRYDGVFAIWYAKGPGVDRSGDAIRHGNLFGTAKHGGVLLLLGDDHICESSTTAHQSEYAMVDAMVPVLNPAGVDEILEYGLLGIAMSRFSGAWVALKCVHDTVESTASIEIAPDRPRIVLPTDYVPPPGGLNIRWPDNGIGQRMALAQEERLHVHKLEAARAFARANRLDRVVLGGEGAWLGVVTAGKSWLDLIAALDDLGIDEARARELGLLVYKVGMTWPLEPVGLAEALVGLEKVIVVEEKRGLIESQAKELLYPLARRPVVVGKRDEAGALLFPSHGSLGSNQIAIAIARRLLERREDATLRERLEAIEQAERAAAGYVPAMLRLPYFCPGCPHNSSTRVPEGSKALAGIGCHFMVQWMDRDTRRFTQMGGEGASWLGEAPFSTRGHIFQNVGDGTFYHSGSLAVRAAVASGANITFKILYNDAVAMTGGQKMETGNLDVPAITRLLQAEGVKEIAVVTDEPGKYPLGAGFAPGVRIHHRSELDAVQRRLREVEGVSALVYDQTCAAEKRRRRKRGTFPDPDERVVINERVCEACGDCGLASNCVAIQPVETEFGRKRRIDQSACNKDFSCLEGFCPSFVSVKGGTLRQASAAGETPFPVLPEPALPTLDGPYGIVVTGVGGTGVVTIAALLGMAAHLEGKGIAALDMIGLAQKGGAVVSHLKLAPTQAEIGAARIQAGGARLVLGCDLVVAAGTQAVPTMRKGATAVVVNRDAVMTGDFTRDPDLALPADRLEQAILSAAGAEQVSFVDAGRLATRLVGDAIGANLFLVGYAWQKGLIPLSRAAIERAIEINGVQVAFNRQAFLWGRRAAYDLAAVERVAGAAEGRRSVPRTLDEIVDHRARFLAGYQDEAYARRYRAIVSRVAAAEAACLPGRTDLARTVAQNLAKLMAIKDEYEVARLWTDGVFLEQLGAEFERWDRLELHLAPPLLAGRDPATGRLKKRRYGPWLFPVLRLLARLKCLRGTTFDPFGRTAERKMERRLLAEYEALLDEILQKLTPENHPLAVELAALPEQMRGFGHVKEANVRRAKAKEAELLATFRGEAALLRAAE